MKKRTQFLLLLVILAIPVLLFLSKNMGVTEEYHDQHGSHYSGFWSTHNFSDDIVSMVNYSEQSIKDAFSAEQVHSLGKNHIQYRLQKYAYTLFELRSSCEIDGRIVPVYYAAVVNRDLEIIELKLIVDGETLIDNQQNYELKYLPA